jgi:hypothetical protein
MPENNIFININIMFTVNKYTAQILLNKQIQNFNKYIKNKKIQKKKQ